MVEIAYCTILSRYIFGSTVQLNHLVGNQINRSDLRLFFFFTLHIASDDNWRASDHRCRTFDRNLLKHSISVQKYFNRGLFWGNHILVSIPANVWNRDVWSILSLWNCPISMGTCSATSYLYHELSCQLQDCCNLKCCKSVHRPCIVLRVDRDSFRHLLVYLLSFQRSRIFITWFNSISRDVCGSP